MPFFRAFDEFLEFELPRELVGLSLPLDNIDEFSELELSRSTKEYELVFCDWGLWADNESSCSSKYGKS
jgi:hypothetical protein